MQRENNRSVTPVRWKLTFHSDNWKHTKVLFFIFYHNDLKRLLTCDHSGVARSTGDMLDVTVTGELQWFWQIDFKQKCTVAQLTVLTPAERVHAVL